jgi:hypothetical protein
MSLIGSCSSVVASPKPPRCTACFSARGSKAAEVCRCSVSVARFTSACCTPGTARASFSTRATQEAQVIP